MANKPVLLIGLGGTGSKIAAKIYNEVPEEEKKKVVVHIFDTDVNEVLGLKASDRTIISTDLTVEKCLLKDYMRQCNADAWFPVEYPTIMKTKFSDGAGQIRAISRLAYMDAIASGKLKELEKKLQIFSQLDGHDNNDDVRVMVVSSLAGGTGSGIFLQTALFIKDYFESRGKSVKIRGAFLLPDIFVKTGTISGSKINNIYANGYACLKELDAILKSTIGNKNDDNINIQLAYKPGMADEKVSIAPYDLTFLYDYENVDGKHLASFEHYKDQISKALYLQLFSDIAGASESDEINMLSGIVEKDGMARYASAGVATLVYPYKDVVDYATYKLASEKMGENWLKLDNIFKHEQEEIDNYKKQGIHREPLKKYVRINEIFDNEVQNDNIFFKNLNRSLHVINKEGELGEKKTAEFIKSVIQRVEEDIENAKEYKDFKLYRTPTENLFAKADDMRNEVEAFESHLNRFKKVVTNSIDDKKNLISNNVMPIHIIEDNDIRKFKYQLAYWVLGEKDGEAMQPIVSRYFLCELKQILMDKVRVLNEETEDLHRLMEQYAKDFGKDKSASEVAAEKVQNSGGFFGMFKKEYKVFAEEYNEKASKQFKRIEEYGYKKILLGVFEDILKGVDDLIENGEEPFFRVLRDIITDFSLKADNLEKQHEDRTDVSKVYILAGADSKIKLYEELAQSIDVDNVLKNTYTGIFMEKYKEFVSRRKREVRRITISSKENYKNKILESYKEKIVESNILDFDVITALRKECEYEGYDYIAQKERLEDIVRNIKNRAKPFMLNYGEDQFKAWGLNPEVLSNLSEDEIEKLFGDISERITNKGFSKYEIIRYTSILGLKAQEFNKFSSGDSQGLRVPGAYFEAYKEKIDKLNRNESAITPHLDKRWHYVNYMPDINDTEAMKDKSSIVNGFVNGLLFENITIRKKEGTDIWVFKDINGNAKEIKNGERELKAEYPNLLVGLGNNPFIVDEIQKIMKDKKEKDFNIFSRELEKHIYMNLARANAQNLVDILIKYVVQTEKAKENEAKEKIIEILNNFMDSSKDYIKEYYGVTKNKTAVEVFTKFIYIILNNSSEFKNSDKGIDFIDDIAQRIFTRVENELNNIGLSANKYELEELKFDDLVSFIKERN